MVNSLYLLTSPVLSDKDEQQTGSARFRRCQRESKTGVCNGRTDLIFPLGGLAP